jgi:hypothetical protein
MSPYGTDSAHIPSLVTLELGGATEEDCDAPVIAPVRDLMHQDNYPVAAGAKIEGTTNGLFLCSKMRLKAMMTVVPMAPNNKKQFHYKDVEASEIAEIFQREYRIQGGEGPRMDIFVAPNELTARFGWADDEAAKLTFKELLGLDPDAVGGGGGDESEPGLTAPEDMENGFVFINELKEVSDHALSYAAQVLITYADSIQGSVTTKLETPLKLKGNVAGISISIAAAPSGKIRMTHGFPGHQQVINRFAMLPESTRRLLLGIPIYSD